MEILENMKTIYLETCIEVKHFCRGKFEVSPKYCARKNLKPKARTAHVNDARPCFRYLKSMELSVTCFINPGSWLSVNNSKSHTSNAWFYTQACKINNLKKKMFNCNGEESVYELYIYYIYTFIYTCLRRKRCTPPLPPDPC